MGAGEMWHHLILPLFFYNEEIIVIFFLKSLLFSEKVFKKSLIESLKFLQSAFECPGWAGTVILGSSGDRRMCLMGNTWAVSNPALLEGSPGSCSVISGTLFLWFSAIVPAVLLMMLTGSLRSDWAGLSWGAVLDLSHWLCQQSLPFLCWLWNVRQGTGG